MMMKGNDTKRQILLNYYEEDKPTKGTLPLDPLNRTP
ncbi:hypothetical protein [Bacillus sp. GeD10]